VCLAHVALWPLDFVGPHAGVGGGAHGGVETKQTLLDRFAGKRNTARVDYLRGVLRRVD
jgi:hypothetical protein